MNKSFFSYPSQTLFESLKVHFFKDDLLYIEHIEGHIRRTNFKVFQNIATIFLKSFSFGSLAHHS